MTMMAAAPAEPPVTPVAARAADRPIPYLEASSYPLTSLLFCVPLIVAYEVGTWRFASDPVSHVQQRIVAFNLMQQFFAAFGVTGLYFPAATVASVLLAWHLARGDRFAATPGVVLGMIAESAMYAVPLVGLGYAFQHLLPLFGQLLIGGPAAAIGGPGAAIGGPAAAIGGPGGTVGRGGPTALLVLSIGAGVYEELIFRLVAFTVLHFLLVDVLRMARATAVPLTVVAAAVLFSLYHYRPTGTEPFQWESFAFRTVAGVYFGLIFTARGFGLTAGAHSAYDVLIVLIKWSAPV